MALCDRSSANILITNNAAIVLGAGTSQEDKSLLADVVRARANFIGNGAGLTNVNATNATTWSGQTTNALAVTALQVTAGATNGAVFVATNTAGQGTWKVLGKIHAGKSDTMPFTNNVYTAVVWDETINQTGGQWDGTSWTPPNVGWVQINVNLWILSGVTLTGDNNFVLKKNGADFLFGSRDYYSGVIPNASAPWVFFNNASTNVYSVWYRPLFGTTVTNIGNSSINFFQGAELP